MGGRQKWNWKDIPPKWVGAGAGLALLTIVLAAVVPNMDWSDVGNAWLFLLAALPISFVVAIGVGMYLAVQRAQFVKVKDGMTLIAKEQVRVIGPRALESHWTVEAMRASHQPVPENFSGTWHAAPVSDQSAIEAPKLVVPTLMELINSGVVRALEPIYLGVTPNGEPIRQRMSEDIGSYYGIGDSGSGKTTDAVAKAIQIALTAADLTPDGKCILLGDPHAGDPESLATRFEGLESTLFGPVASSDADILAMIERAVEVVTERKANPRGPNDPPYPPLFLLIDEWLSLLRGKHGKEMDLLLTKVATEGRKKNVNAGLYGQGGTVASAGDVRNYATSTFVFRTRADKARYAVGQKLPVSPRGFADGEHYAFTRHGEWKSILGPWISPEEVAEVGHKLAVQTREATLKALPRSFKVLPGGSRQLPVSAEENGAEGSFQGSGSIPGLDGRVPEAWEARIPDIFQAYREGISWAEVRRTVLMVGSSGREGKNARIWLEWLLREGEWREEGGNT